MIKELEYPAYENAAPIQRISWGAVLAGALTSLSVLTTLTAFGAGFGLAFPPAMGTVAREYGLGSASWMVLSGAASYFAGGWVAGRLTGIARVSESVIHGLAAWSVCNLGLALLFNPSFVGSLGWVSRGLTAPSPTNAFGSLLADQAVRGTIEGELGIAGRLTFVMLAAGAAAAAYGARSGLRVLRPVPMVAVRREPVGPL